MAHMWMNLYTSLLFYGQTSYCFHSKYFKKLFGMLLEVELQILHTLLYLNFSSCTLVLQLPRIYFGVEFSSNLSIIVHDIFSRFQVFYAICQQMVTNSIPNLSDSDLLV